MKEHRIIKRVMPSGKAGSVYVPKEWMNKRVVVRLVSVENYVRSAIEPHGDSIEATYLYGSHARKEAGPGSDINVFIVAKRELPQAITNGMNAEIVLEKDLEAYAEKHRLHFLSMIREAIPLIDRGLLDKLKERMLEKNETHDYLKEVSVSIELSERLSGAGDHTAAVYHLMLRLKGMYAIEKGAFGHGGFSEYIAAEGVEKDVFSRLHSAYRAERDGKPYAREISAPDAHVLRETVKKKLYRHKTYLSMNEVSD